MIREGIDPTNLNEAGWGIILANDADPAIMEALQPLLEIRQQQAGSRFRLYSQDAGFQVGKDNKTTFLTRNGVGPGPANPERMPYYLLIVGSPEDIPYRFQAQLDVQYAVGRIHFETPAEYATYAQTVALAEAERPSSGRLAIFSTAHPDDRHTQLTTEHLTIPLMHALAERCPQWMQQKLIGENATKAGLTELLRAKAPVGLLFCACHGIAFPPGHSRQHTQQGALLCADWPGPAQWSEPIPPDFYFSADDLTGDMNLTGMIAFLWASYAGGAPQPDEFAPQGKSSDALANRQATTGHSFLAHLPMKMLSRPRGALAVIGLIDSVWGYAFSWDKMNVQTAVFENTLYRLLNGHPIGAALEGFNQRYAELSTELSAELEEIEFGKRYDPLELAGMWAANNDARNYVIIGDPAVRLTAGSTR